MYALCPPFLLSSVFGTRAAQQEGMQALSSLDEALAQAVRVQQASPDSPVAAELTLLLRDSWWQNTQVALEAIQTGRDCAFNAASAEMRSLSFGIFAGPSNTKHSAEDVFAHLQHVSARSQKGMLRMSKPLALPARAS